jgi:outer membrane protein OmpA-like peptidoglycan-associated protein
MIAIQRLFSVFLATSCLGLAACSTTQDLERPAERTDGRVDNLGAAMQRMNESQQALGQRINQLEASHGDRINKLNSDVQQLDRYYQSLGAKVDANHNEFIKSRLEGKLLRQVFLTEDRIMYPVNSPDIPPQDAKALDNLAKELKNSDTVYHIEIQGHTDDSGMSDFDYNLGEGRAKAVHDYLYRHGGIPLYRMSIISFGALLPAANDPGATANRRVKLMIYR